MEEPEWKGMSLFFLPGGGGGDCDGCIAKRKFDFNFSENNLGDASSPARWYQLMIEMNGEIWSSLKLLRA